MKVTIYFSNNWSKVYNFVITDNYRGVLRFSKYHVFENMLYHTQWFRRKFCKIKLIKISLKFIFMDEVYVSYKL